MTQTIEQNQQQKKQAIEYVKKYASNFPNDPVAVRDLLPYLVIVPSKVSHFRIGRLKIVKMTELITDESIQTVEWMTDHIAAATAEELILMLKRISGRDCRWVGMSAAEQSKLNSD